MASDDLATGACINCAEQSYYQVDLVTLSNPTATIIDTSARWKKTATIVSKIYICTKCGSVYIVNGDTPTPGFNYAGYRLVPDWGPF